MADNKRLFNPLEDDGEEDRIGLTSAEKAKLFDKSFADKKAQYPDKDAMIKAVLQSRKEIQPHIGPHRIDPEAEANQAFESAVPLPQSLSAVKDRAQSLDSNRIPARNGAMPAPVAAPSYLPPGMSMEEALRTINPETGLPFSVRPPQLSPEEEQRREEQRFKLEALRRMSQSGGR